MPATALRSARIVKPGSFNPDQHYYPRVLNAQIHPMVASFLRLGHERLASRYCHLNPQVDRKALDRVLRYLPRFLRWAGADLFMVATAAGVRRMVVVETNSCPSGQKSMPLVQEAQEQGGYRALMEHTIGPAFARHRFRSGGLAVLYDKNLTENSGYAAAMADYFDEPVYLVPFFDSDGDPPARFTDSVLEVRDEAGRWQRIRAAQRYVTQRPWNRIPVQKTRTLMLNPILGCLAGGRNKMVAAMAYELYNAEMAGTGLSIRTPETIRDVHKREVPLLVRRFGGHAVVKIPYSNAGLGVFTITNDRELEGFMGGEYPYQRFIVQSLIGNYHWSSEGAFGRFYHVGTIPNRNNQIYVADVRIMVGAGEDGFRPIAVYGRRARVPMEDQLPHEVSSWDMLGTNLSVKTGVDAWDTETHRLVLMDRKDFNMLGIGVDDLISGYVQTVMSVIAIDRMAANLINSKGRFRPKLFRSLNDDEALIAELNVE